MRVDLERTSILYGKYSVSFSKTAGPPVDD